MTSTTKLNDVLQKVSLPPEAVFLGMATDGFPVLLNAYDPNPKNILILEKESMQGINVLKAMAEYLANHHQGNRIEFLVISNHPDEWKFLSSSECLLGIIPFSDAVLVDMIIKGLHEWVEDKKIAKYPILVLIDSMENESRLSQKTRDYLCKIMLRGPKQKIRVIGVSSVDDGWGFSSTIFGMGDSHKFYIQEHEDLVEFAVPEV